MVESPPPPASCGGATEVNDARAALSALDAREMELKQRAVYLRREMREQRLGRSAKAAHEQRRALADILREEKKLLAGKNIVEAAHGEPPASDELVDSVVALLNGRLRQLYVDPQKRSWFKLFRQVDVDGSGLISFDEFKRMVRSELRVSALELPESPLRAVWLALDTDGSGHVTAGEFGKFMRRGEISNGVQTTRYRRKAWHSDEVESAADGYWMQSALHNRQLRVARCEQDVAMLEQQLDSTLNKRHTEYLRIGAAVREVRLL